MYICGCLCDTFIQICSWIILLWQNIMLVLSWCVLYSVLYAYLTGLCITPSCQVIKIEVCSDVLSQGLFKYLRVFYLVIPVQSQWMYLTQFANGKIWLWSMKSKWPGRFLKPMLRVPDPCCPVTGAQHHTCRSFADSSGLGSLNTSFSFVTEWRFFSKIPLWPYSCSQSFEK